MEETLAFYGSEVKALGGGKVGGYAVLFTTEPDLQGDIFTKSTDFFIHDGDERPILYRHGMYPVIKSRQLGRGKLSIDEVGIFLEGELNLRDNYEKAIYKLAEMGKLGYSTGSMGHLVNKTAKNKSFEINSWPIGEVSLTPNPVEARTSAFPLKSMADEEIDLDEFIKSLEPQEEEKPVSLEGLPALKALCEALSPAVSIRMLEHSEVADAAVKELLTHGRVFVDAFKHYRVRVDQHVEFRKERNRTLSDSQEKALKSWKDGLSKIRLDIESIETDIDGTLKLTGDARAQADAAQRHAEFLMQRLSDLSSTIAKE